MTGDALDVVALLGTSWGELEAHGTRWHHVLRAWRDHLRIADMTVVGYPDVRLGALASPAAALVREEATWLDGVTALHATFPGRGDGRLAALAARRLARELRNRLRRGRPALVVAAAPIWVPVARRLRAHHAGFDAVDDWRASREFRDVVGLADRGYHAARSLRCTAVSQPLADALATDYQLRCRVIGNGVRLDAPADVAMPPLPNPPFAVYVGYLQNRVDVELLVDVAALLGDRLPIVVVGPGSGPECERLRRTAIRLTGAVRPDAVPAVLARASVGIIPHRDTRLTRSMDPLKLLEYLAAGLPVVSTPIAIAPEFAPFVRVARGAADFAASMERAARLGRRPVPEPVRRRSWTTVADSLLRHYLSVRGAPDTEAAP